jgi:23S rRNA (guanosine2251-2'-O)-methyltransferase
MERGIVTGGQKKRGGAVRKSRKGPTKGTGGQGRRALEGRGPTPKAEDRPYHPAAKRKASRSQATSATSGTGGERGSRTRPRPPRPASAGELIAGRNPVVEALTAHVPVKSLYIASGVTGDERVHQAVSIAAKRGLPVLEVPRAELDRMAGPSVAHQGVLLSVPPYRYARPLELLDAAGHGDRPALFVALDGVTDPHNLGAVIRSAAAFGAHGVIVPERRSAGMTAAAWKTSAGAAARVRVALAGNLTRTLTDFQERGVFVVGLDGAGPTPLPGLPLADRPLVLVIGSEGKGLSRLVAKTCDVVAAIPIEAATESLNASVAAGVALYEVARLRRV